MFEDIFIIPLSIFIGFLFLIAVMIFSDLTLDEEDSNYKIIEVQSIAKHSGNLGDTKLEVEYGYYNDVFGMYRIMLGEYTHVRKYDNLAKSERLILSIEDYELFVGPVKSYSVSY